MNALSLRQAQSCENAAGPTCQCRCGGQFHGKARVADTRTLPVDDPHSPSKECERCNGSGKRVYPDRGSASLVMLDCAQCKGTGRYIARRVMRQALPTDAELSETEPDEVPAA